MAKQKPKTREESKKKPLFSNSLQQSRHDLKVENPQYQTIVDYKLRTHGRINNPV